MPAPKKTSFADLAISGGPAAFPQPLHVGRPNVGSLETFQRLTAEMFERRWFTNNGPLVQRFEERIAKETKTRHAVAFCNATVALEVLVRALGLDGEVIVPGFTFVATAHCLEWLRVKPVFCDVDAQRHTIDVRHAEQLITPKTKAIVGTHLWGNPCDIAELEALAKARGLKLFFDAAHAYGCSYRGTPIGGFGDAEVFSFHGTKFVNAFEGGAVTTNDDELAKALRLMRNFGFATFDTVVSEGTNGKMTEVCAAMGLTSLDSLDSIVATNRSHHARYAAKLNAVRGLRVSNYYDGSTPNYQYVVTEVDASSVGLTRNELVEVLAKENVLARKYFTPGCHKMEPYASRGGHAPLPVTDHLAESLIALPTGTAITEDDIDVVTSIIATAVEHNERVRAQLRSSRTE